MTDFAEMLRASASQAGRRTSTVFAEEPVSLTVFVQDRKYLNNPPLSLVQYTAVRHIERVYYEDTYPLLAAEFEAGKKPDTTHIGPAGVFHADRYWSLPIRMTNFATLQWGKGSSSRFTPVYNARTGQWVRLCDWNAQDQVASAYPEDGKIVSATGTAAFREGHGRMFQVRTRKGYEIEVWEGHRFLTWARRRWATGRRVARWSEGGGAAWARLWDLSVGDPIAVASTLPEPTECLIVPDREVELVGRCLGSAYKTETPKALSQEFYSLDNRQTALLLSRLIDTDGWISLSNTAEIGYGTTSKQLAIDVQRLMLRLGAVAELKDKRSTYRGEPYLSYQVRVRDRRGLISLAQHLTLLDKESARLGLLDWLQDRAGRKQRAGHGDLVWDKIESITYVGDDEYWTLSVDGPACYVSSNGILDRNSGKDHVARVASMRIAYLLMCLHSPQDYYGMPAQDTIHLLNVASSSAQAQQAFFLPVTRVVKSGWFVGHCEPRQNVISYSKNVESVSGHSDAETQEGLNLLLGIADEIDAFKSKKESATRRGASAREPTKTAEGILNMMRTSGATRFPEVFKSVRISYPRYLGSTIQRLTADAKADIKENGKKSRHFVSGPLATWEVNPRVKGREAFEGDYKEDPVMARSKYECKPARAVNPYFRNHLAVDASFTEVSPLPLEATYRLEEGSAGRKVWVPSYHFANSLYPVSGAVYAMHADLAVHGDRAGVAMAHVVNYSHHEILAEDEDGAQHPVREIRPHVKVDFVISYSADASAQPPREIQIRWARQLCFELVRRGFNIRRFTFDTFQCLSGETLIPLLDGSPRKLCELVGQEPFWLYSVSDGWVVLGLCTRAWKTGHRQDMVEVELDNGQLVRATSDHQFMLRDGTYCRADRLPPGARLMPWRSADVRVVAVRSAAPEEVYDLQVKDHHNFALGAGVFVHNSTDSMQILEDKGIECQKVSTDLSEDPWRNLRDLMYEGRVSIPRPVIPPGASNSSFLLRDELLSLTRLPNGRVDHPADGSKDLADALSCSVLGAVVCGGAEESVGKRAHYAPPDITVGQVFDMPLGVSLRHVWERPDLPTLF